MSAAAPFTAWRKGHKAKGDAAAGWTCTAKSCQKRAGVIVSITLPAPPAGGL